MPSHDLELLKSKVNFRSLVLETQAINKAGKTLCPNHPDHDPSCHIYDDHAHCYTCGWHADAIGWVMATYNLTFKYAVTYLERPLFGNATRLKLKKHSTPRKKPKTERTTLFKPIPEQRVSDYLQQAALLDRLPKALEGRGFTLEDAHLLSMARDGEDLLFLLPSPDGKILAIKRRRARLCKGQRYFYETPGHGAPPWCSPDFMAGREVLVIEGELNGMACWLARPELSVMGMAAATGKLHLEVFNGKVIYIYSDDDTPGQKARERWAKEALDANAKQVFVLEPWEMDACDIAGALGRDALRERLR